MMMAIRIRGYDKADIIFIGVSRCGKTPSCLYMALQYGILAANYPFTEDELWIFILPSRLRPYKKNYLAYLLMPNVYNKFEPNAAVVVNMPRLSNAASEVAEVEAMYQREGISFINSTYFSIEEIATKVLALSGVKRKL